MCYPDCGGDQDPLDSDEGRGRGDLAEIMVLHGGTSAYSQLRL